MFMGNVKFPWIVIVIEYNFEVIFLDWFNSVPARGEFLRLLMIFANSLDPDQTWQNILESIF